MTATRTMLSTSFALLLTALSSEAQRLAPLAMRASEAAPIDRGATSAAVEATVRDTLPTPRREISPVGTILGGVAGGVVGTFAGILTGGAIARGCQGEMCGLGPVLLGSVIGESVGLAAGAHLGSRSSRHEHVVASALASTGVLIAGVFLGAGIARVGGPGVVMVPVTPALQLAAALAIESH